MNNSLSAIPKKIYEELKDGNPIAILIVLMVLVVLGSGWVWQTTHNSVVNVSTPKFSHPSAVAPLALVTIQAPNAVPSARVTVTPPPVTATPTPTQPLSDLGSGFSAAVYRGSDWGIGRHRAREVPEG